jgi:cyclic pyranopterin phosphate synthase
VELTDLLLRRLRDLRISVTDRCNFRCTYCMPKEVFGPGFQFLQRSEVLSFEEIERLTRLFVGLGVEKVRLTGGEPLVRSKVERLVEMLAAVDGVGDLAMTTNGALLARKAPALAAAGLRRVTVSLDSLDDATFRAMNDMAFPLERVLAGIDAAAAAGLGVKINTVVKRGVNDGDVVALAERFRGTGQVVRFIEFMDVGTTNGWRLDEVVPSAEIVERIGERWPLEPVGSRYAGEVARRYRYADGGGEIGVISSVTQPFCGACSRARLTADGKLFTCLFGGRGHDLRTLLRSGADDAEVVEHLRAIWTVRDDRYSELRTASGSRGERVEMSRIGG